MTLYTLCEWYTQKKITPNTAIPNIPYELDDPIRAEINAINI
jgi:hypothetical protein